MSEMTKEPKLKPCPFCGSETEICGGKVFYDKQLGEQRSDFYVMCKKKCCCTNRFKTARKASNAWNRRISRD